MPLKILTVNLPESFIEAMEALVQEVYPSRSELIRVAVREFLVRVLESVWRYTEIAQEAHQPAPRDTFLSFLSEKKKGANENE
jgi:Arc/MetJ-type ribon-helix-helix transcriptional regulator